MAVDAVAVVGDAVADGAVEGGEAALAEFSRAAERIQVVLRSGVAAADAQASVVSR